jgi:hypothetical protein
MSQGTGEKTMKVTDIRLTATAEGTMVDPRNALGQRVAKTHLPGCGDFTTLGVPVEVKMPVSIVRSILRGRGALIQTAR